MVWCSIPNLCCFCFPEGSIGSKGAVDVNSSPVSTALAGRRPDLMVCIQFANTVVSLAYTVPSEKLALDQFAKIPTFSSLYSSLSAVQDLMVSLANLQIKFCTCTGRLSSSSPHSLKNADISMTCKSCTDESTADRGGPSCSGKRNKMGLELPRPIDLDVKWKTVNRRQRATRRARTYFGEDTSRDGIGSFYLFGCATNQEMAQDAPVSESEKVLTFLH